MTKFYEVLRVGETASRAEIIDVYQTLDDPSIEQRTAFETLSDPERRFRYDTEGDPEPSFIRAAEDTYRIVRFAARGDIADVYQGVAEDSNQIVAIKIAREPGEFMGRECVAITSNLRPSKASDSDKKSFRYFPSILSHLRAQLHGSTYHCTIFEWLDGFHTFEEIKTRLGGNLRFEHVVWMLNRVLEALDIAHRKGVSHCAILPCNLMAFSSLKQHPMNHGVKVIGWCHNNSSHVDQMNMISPYENLYPPTTERASLHFSKSRDVYMAVQCALYMLAGTDAPEYLIEFLDQSLTASRNDWIESPWKLHEALKEYMAKHYGPKKYIPFSIDNPNP